jgi:hypothetical protein
MQQDADFVLAKVEVVVAFSWRRAVSALAGSVGWAEVSREVEVGEAG